MSNSNFTLTELFKFHNSTSNPNSNKVASDILFLAIISSATENINKLSDGNREKAITFLEPGEKFNLLQALKLYKNENKLEDLYKSIEEKSKSLKTDYYQTYISQLSKDNKTRLFNKFPSLKKLSK